MIKFSELPISSRIVRAVRDMGFETATEIQEKAADFLREFSGVQFVATENLIRQGVWNESTSKYLRGTHLAHRGDLIIELQPGWTFNNDDEKVKQADTQTKVIRNNAVLTPLVFMGNGIKPERIYREVKATEVAPTVTHVLRIRPPNAAGSLPLPELIDN